MKKFDVLIVGELNVDLILNDIEGPMQVGKEVFAREMTLTLGSSSAIFANNISILGAKTSFLGMLGEDNFSRLITKSLVKSGVDISNLIYNDNLRTGITVAANYGEERAMVTYPGAMSELRVSDISDEVLATASHLHVSSIFLQEGLLPEIHQLFRRAKAFGMTTSLDPQWDPNEKWNINLKNLLPFVDVFLPNEIELLLISGSNTLDEAIQKIVPFSNIIAVKMGVKGATVFYEGNTIHQDAYVNEKMIDAIGAGDSFDAGFIRAYIKGLSVEKCLELAVLAGAVNTTASGGTGAFTSYESFCRTAFNYFNYNVQIENLPSMHLREIFSCFLIWDMKH